MSRTLKSTTEVDAQVIEVRRLLDADPELTKSAACKAVGLSESTYRYREGNGARAAAPQDFIMDGEPADVPRSVDDQLIPVFEVDYSHLGSLDVYPLGDIHKGAVAHAQAQWRQWLAYLAATPATSMLFTGDGLNAAILGSVSDVYEETMTVGEAKRELAHELEPVADKIDGMIRGNHENRIWKAVGDCPIEDIADRLGVNYSPDAMVVVYRVGDQTYDLFMRHGSGGGGMMGSQVNNLERQARIVDADIYVSGHTHTQVAFPKDILRREGLRLVRDKQFFICSGSFLGLEAYAVQKGYPPAHIGAPRIHLDGRTRDVHVSV